MNTVMQSERSMSRLRLRHDLVFAQVPGGALVRHSDGGFVLRGQTTYRWLTSLAPFLDGSRTSAELVDGLDESRSKMVEDLLSVLTEHEAVSLVGGDPIDPTGPLAAFLPQIAYIDHYADDGVARFQRFRDAHVTISGDPELGEIVGRGLLRNGLRRIAGQEEVPAKGVAELRVIIDAAGAPVEIARATRRPGSDVYPVTRIGDRVVLGPISTAGSSVTWSTAMARMTENDETESCASMWRALSDPSYRPDPAPLSRVQAGLVGTMVAYDVFRHLTGAPPPEASGAIVMFDVITGDTSREEILADPRAAGVRIPEPPEIEAWPTAMLEPGDRGDVEAEQLQRYLRLVGATTGLVTGFTDEMIDQSPIKLARAVYRRSGTPHQILGFSLDNLGDARRRAMEAAALEYVGDIGPRETKGRLQGRRVHSWELELATGLGPSGAGEPLVVPGRTLSGELVVVPQAAVWSRHSVNAPGVFERTTAGEGAGATMAAAVAAGLLSAAAYRALATLARRGLVHHVRADTLGPGSAYLLDAAGLTGVDPILAELPHTAAGCVVIARNSLTSDYAIGTGWSTDGAVQDAMLRLLGRTLLPSAEPGADLRLIGGFVPSALSLRWASEPFVASTNPPRGTVIVDTTTDDIRSTGALRTVRVLLPVEAD